MFIHIPELLTKQMAKDLKASNPLPLENIELVTHWSLAAMLNGNCLAEAKNGKSTTRAIQYLKSELAAHMKDLNRK